MLPEGQGKVSFLGAGTFPGCSPPLRAMLVSPTPCTTPPRTHPGPCRPRLALPTPQPDRCVRHGHAACAAAAAAAPGTHTPQGDHAAPRLHRTRGSVPAKQLGTGERCRGGRWASLAGLRKGTAGKALFLPRKTPCALREQPVSSRGTGQSCSPASLPQREHPWSGVTAGGRRPIADP